MTESNTNIILFPKMAEYEYEYEHYLDSPKGPNTNTKFQG